MVYSLWKVVARLGERKEFSTTQLLNYSTILLLNYFAEN